MSPKTRAQVKRPRSESPLRKISSVSSTSSTTQDTKPIHVEFPQKLKKLKLHSSYAASSPFPTFAHPTPAECLEVHDLLTSHHRTDQTRRPPQDSSNSAETCGSVPNVIDSLIGTILSQNTSNKNSSAAKRNLDAKFRDFAAIANAPREDVVEALKHGGLANKKAKTIQDILGAIKAKHGDYSLQHLTSPNLSNSEIMQELISYDGVGPKTASCVLLFCLGRDSFAVDTHVYRLTKILGWVPPKADRVLAQAHLDLKVPDELKYGLHVLLIQHGRACSGCKGGESKGELCVLKKYLREKKGIKEE